MDPRQSAQLWSNAGGQPRQQTQTPMMQQSGMRTSLGSACARQSSLAEPSGPPIPGPSASPGTFKKNRTGSRSVPRGPGFSEAENESLLSAIESVVPVGRDEWEQVLKIHNQRWSCTSRTVDAIRRKFARMHQTKAPTGNPNIPASIARAKHLRELIVEASETIGETIDDEELGFDSLIGVSNSTDVIGNDSVLPALPSTQVSPMGENPVVSEAQPGAHDSETRQNRRPIVERRRDRRQSTASPPIDISALVRLQLQQDKQRLDEEREERKRRREEAQLDREERRERWEQERRDRREAEDARMRQEEAERKARFERDEAERKDRREREEKRHEQLMELMALSMSKKQG